MLKVCLLGQSANILTFLLIFSSAYRVADNSPTFHVFKTCERVAIVYPVEFEQYKNWYLFALILAIGATFGLQDRHQKSVDHGLDIAPSLP